jgi:hypothetical protein
LASWAFQNQHKQFRAKWSCHSKQDESPSQVTQQVLRFLKSVAHWEKPPAHLAPQLPDCPLLHQSCSGCQ